MVDEETPYCSVVSTFARLSRLSVALFEISGTASRAADSRHRQTLQQQGEGWFWKSRPDRFGKYLRPHAAELTCAKPNVQGSRILAPAVS